MLCGIIYIESEKNHKRKEQKMSKNLDKNITKILNFLNVSENVLFSQDLNIIDKMIQAANDDDMWKVHQLGYSLFSVT
jgi:hypothetical protein